MINLSKNEKGDQEVVTCCVMNCQKKISIEKAVRIKDKFFCPICGVAYYRSSLNI